AQVAYAWAYNGALDASAAYQLAEEGYRLYLHPGPFAVGETSFPGAGFMAPVDENPDSLHARVRSLVDAIPVEIYALDTNYARQGSDLGSGVLRPISRPAVAVVTRDGTDTTSWG